jgi:flagellar export protein FliJ
MSTLESLIRVHRWQVDERSRQVAQLEALSEKLRHELARLAEERTHEQAVAGTSFVARHVYPGYIRRAMERQKTLEQSLAETEAQTVAAREALAAAFQELKRYEVAQANRARLRISAAARRERLETDALAIDAFRRANGR